MKRILAALLLIPSLALGQVTTNPGVTGVVGTTTTGSGSVVLQNSPTLTGTVTTSAISATTISGSSDFIGAVGAAGTMLIRTNTADGTDSARIFVSGGAGAGVSRGGYLIIGGNEYLGLGAGGDVDVSAGNVAGAKVFQSIAGTPVTTVTAAGLGITGTITASAIVSAAGNELLCYNTAGGVITYAATVVGCVPSGLQFKDVAGRIDPRTALKAVVKMTPGYGTFKDTKTFGTDERVWLFADEVCAVDERLCKRDAQGRPENYDKYGTVAYIVAAMKAQQAQIKSLQREVKQLQKEQYAARQSKIRPAAYVTH
jgi:hypothetical protein